MEDTTKALRDFYPKRYDVSLLIISASMLLAVGMSLPLFKVTQMVLWKSSYSIITGVKQLFIEGEHFIGTIIMLFSIVFPTTKLVALTIIWMIRLSAEKRKIALHWLGYLGKWSMLDVFIVALMILAIKLKALARVELQAGFYVFSAAILISLIAVNVLERLAGALERKPA